ncbi:hypothetical protein DCS_06625 [Drechmeria coniospora]|uniref:Uncharacterized protein n=1 Tax=Drechmeria coniospora TaxID=98403 RepID=A0A151GC94_DRECN|nr:hypothetical protein DCS_06625 [Drechmeria coniospora]KYK54665.1 hypothetical protein DCS_06625 [Drechmeria coniospora]
MLVAVLFPGPALNNRAVKLARIQQILRFQRVDMPAVDDWPENSRARTENLVARFVHDPRTTLAKQSPLPALDANSGHCNAETQVHVPIHLRIHASPAHPPP